MKSPLNRGGLRFYLVSIALLLGTVLFKATTPRSILAGLPCLFLGILLHTWAKGCLRQNQLVATTGPYRFVRHPFYLANALIDAGLVVMAGWLPLAVVLPVWWLAIYIPVIRGEEHYLSEKFPDVYPDYRRRVPCLIPWRRPLASTGDGFRWDNPNIAGGEELPRAVRIAAYPLLFFALQGICNAVSAPLGEGQFRFSPLLLGEGQGVRAWLSNGWNLTAATGLLSLYALAWQLHRHQRQRRSILPPLLQHPLFRLAAAGAVLAAVCIIARPQTSCNNMVLWCGVGTLLVSVPVYARRPTRAILAELLALLGAVAAGELLWLAPPLAAICEAWLLDRQLAANDRVAVQTLLALSLSAARGGQRRGDRRQTCRPDIALSLWRALTPFQTPTEGALRATLGFGVEPRRG